MKKTQHKKILKALKRFLKDDSNFQALHLDTLKAFTNKAPAMFSDFIIDAINPYNNPKKVKKHYLKMLDSFLLSFNYDLDLHFYIIDKPYLDITWLRIEDMLIDLDKIYLDFKAYLNG